MNAPAAPIVVHIVHRFAVGGLENGVVNLVNRLPAQAWRHKIIALTDIDPAFASRIERDDVELIALGKGPGHAIPLYPRLFSLLRSWRPAVVHTRNLAALEAVIPAWAAGVPVRVHGEHGRDVDDLHGTRVRYQRVRRLYRPFVGRYVALSPDLADYLHARVGVPATRIEQIYNGVDIVRFRRAQDGRGALAGCPFTDPALWLVGTVGRMESVKDQTNLARAFVIAVSACPDARARMRLVLVGDGHLRRDAEAILIAAGVRDLAWFAGERADVPAMLCGIDCFVLPSLAEGVSNTILEAMACGLPVIATAVGANAELVEDGVTGRIVPAADSDALAHALLAYFDDPVRAARDGVAGAGRAERNFSLERMVDRYHRLYTNLLTARVPGVPSPVVGVRRPPA
ncbi:MAG: TIGR03088 family PEP-CTERM/XrtA system glycosyltransferase [Casimicrobiaceae bacterium]